MPDFLKVNIIKRRGGRKNTWEKSKGTDKRVKGQKKRTERGKRREVDERGAPGRKAGRRLLEKGNWKAFGRKEPKEKGGKERKEKNQ